MSQCPVAPLICLLLLTGHGEAYELCGYLHRDVSAGNILILPMIGPTTKSGGFLVLWSGVLSDWELAKKIPEKDEKLKARQPHRTVRVSLYLFYCGLCAKSRASGHLVLYVGPLPHPPPNPRFHG